MTSEEELRDAARAQERRELRRRRWPIWLVRALAVIAIWLVFGFVRAPAVARDWLARQYRAGQRAVNIATEFVAPLVPPFWLVNVHADVIEAGGTAPVYTSYQLLLVEPITGTVLMFGQG
jgi:hypothetical protein